MKLAPSSSFFSRSGPRFPTKKPPTSRNEPER
jgi:hypothetical protein